MKRYRIRFLPLDIVYTAEDGENLLDFVLRIGVHLNASCGGFGTCGRCKVKLIEGNLELRKNNEVSHLESGEGFILACQSYIKGDATIEIPVESQIDIKDKGLREKTKRLSASPEVMPLNTVDADPMVFKNFINVEPHTKGMAADDLSILLKALKKAYGHKEILVNLESLKKLPTALRMGNWQITATLFEQDKYLEIINIEPFDTTDKQYAIALDIGTTTVCGRIIYLKQDENRVCRALEETSSYNAQISYGDDVISRIMHTKKKGGLKKLQEAVVKTVNTIIEELIERSGIASEDIMFMVAAGNTTMTHLFLGVEPQYIMIEPYTPCFLFPPVVRAKDLGIRLFNEMPIFLYPCVASYVGGDIVAGIISSGIYKEKGVSLFIDIGTNGEIVLSGPDWMLCASCSAGPAFEGGGIKDGMRATRGAIEQIRIDPTTFEPTFITIGHTRPSGICGSGLIDAVSEMFLSGIITQNGKINRDLDTERIREVEDLYEYVICYGKETLTGKDITITEADIDNIMRAKAAMFAGCKVLVDISGMDFDDIDRVIIAGGFGHFIDPVKAQLIGLLPEIPLEKFKFVGNASLHGASLYALSKEYAREAVRVANMMTNIDLSNNNSFMDQFMAAMFLPHTDERLFTETFKRIRDAKDKRLKILN